MDIIVAVLFALFVWWMGTAVIIHLDSRPRRTHRMSVVVATVIAAGALYSIAWTADDTSTMGAYVAFSSAVALWGWHELTFLTGWVTGPRKAECPEGVRGWRRFLLATETLIHHEVALAVTLAVVAAVTWEEPNPVAAWTFAVLWTMRLSSKLNLFLGVRNIAIEFIPDHLRYLASYFGRARMNPLMPISIVSASLVIAQLARSAAHESTNAFGVIGATLTATLLTLAVLEHLFMTVPLPDALLWRWILPKRTMETS